MSSLKPLDVAIFDIEANGYYHQATTVWCGWIKDVATGRMKGYRPHEIDKLVEDVARIKVKVGHNILDFDLPVLQKLHGLEWSPEGCFDTLLASRLLWPDRPGGHSLDEWGQRLGNHKGDFHEFDQFSEKMFLYCQQDVSVNYDILLEMVKQLGMRTEQLIHLPIMFSEFTMYNPMEV